MAAPMPDARKAAHRMWLSGLSRAAIARQLDVKPNTVSHWRWQDGWPARRDYGLRPIPPPVERAVSAKNPHGEAPRSQRHYACEYCGTRSDNPAGHPDCRPAA